MKNKPSQLAKYILLILIIITTCDSLCSQTKFDVKNTEAILISVAMLEMHEPRPSGDEAVLITDKTKMAKFVKLFNGNRKAVAHACGYHWRLTFLRKEDGPVNIWFNENCEEFENNTEEICDLVQKNFKKIRKNPTEFISEIGVEANVSPEYATGELSKNRNFRIFILGELDDRFPFIELEANAASTIPEDRSLWDSAKKEVVKKVKKVLYDNAADVSKRYPVLKRARPDFRSSRFGGGEIQETYRLKVFFHLDTKLDGIEKYFTNAKLVRKEEPEFYYLQLVSNERHSESFAKHLMSEFPFIKKVSPYNGYPK